MGFSGRRGGGLQRNGDWNPASAQTTTFGPIIGTPVFFRRKNAAQTYVATRQVGAMTFILWDRPSDGFTALANPATVASGASGVFHIDTFDGGASLAVVQGGTSSASVQFSKSLDGGVSWTNQATVLAGIQHITAARLASTTTAWVVARDSASPQKNRLWRTVNSGVTWTIQATLSDLFPTFTSGGAITPKPGSSTAVYVQWWQSGQSNFAASNDAGATWPITGTASSDTQRPVFLGDGRLLISRGAGLVPRVKPAGSTWTSDESDYPGFPYPGPSGDLETIDGAGFILKAFGLPGHVLLSEAGDEARIVRGAWPDDTYLVSVVDDSTLAVFTADDGCGFIDRIKKGVL